jgi:hypothetical protein
MRVGTYACMAHAPLKQARAMRRIRRHGVRQGVQASA